MMIMRMIARIRRYILGKRRPRVVKAQGRFLTIIKDFNPAIILFVKVLAAFLQKRLKTPPLGLRQIARILSHFAKFAFMRGLSKID